MFDADWIFCRIYLIIITKMNQQWKTTSFLKVILIFKSFCCSRWENTYLCLYLWQESLNKIVASIRQPLTRISMRRSTSLNAIQEVTDSAMYRAVYECFSNCKSCHTNIKGDTIGQDKNYNITNAILPVITTLKWEGVWTRSILTILDICKPMRTWQQMQLGSRQLTAIRLPKAPTTGKNHACRISGNVLGCAAFTKQTKTGGD